MCISCLAEGRYIGIVAQGQEYKVHLERYNGENDYLLDIKPGSYGLVFLNHPFLVFSYDPTVSDDENIGNMMIAMVENSTLEDPETMARFITCLEEDGFKPSNKDVSNVDFANEMTEYVYNKVKDFLYNDPLS